MLTSVILALTLQQRAIDFDHKGAPVERVVAAMAEAYGEEMRADGTMSRDFVIVSFKNVTPERSRELLATALNAEWKERDDVLILHRPKKLLDEEASRESDLRAKLIQDALSAMELPPRLTGATRNKFIDDLTKFRAVNDQNVGVSSFETTPLAKLVTRLPVHRAVRLLATEIGATDLAELPESEHRAYSIQGGIGTRRLSNAAAQILNQFVQDQNALIDTWEVRAGGVNQIQDMWRVDPDPNKALVFVRRSRNSVTVTLHHAILDQPVDIDAQIDLFRQDLSTTPVVKWPDGLDSHIELSDIAWERVKIRAPRTVSKEQIVRPSDALLSVYLEEDEHDHLELATSEVVLQAARASGKSFVVVAPDIFASYERRFIRTGPIALKLALPTIFGAGLVETEVMDDAIIVRPILPSATRDSRFGREEFAKALEAFRERSDERLGTLADLAHSTDSNGFTMSLSLLGFLSRVHVRSSWDNSVGLLRLYGKLPNGLRVQAANGGLVMSLREMHAQYPEFLEGVFALRLMSVNTNQILRLPEIGGISYEEQRRKTPLLRKLDPDTLIRIRAASAITLFTQLPPPYQFLRPTATTPEQMGALNAYNEYFKDKDSVLSASYRKVNEQYLIATVLTRQGEVFLCSYYVPAIYEGDEFSPFSSLTKAEMDRFERAKRDTIKRIGGQSPAPGIVIE